MQIKLIVAAVAASCLVASAAFADVGPSPAIEAFELSRLIEAQTPEDAAALEAGAGTLVSTDPIIEAARVKSVVNWFILTYARYWAEDADLDWAPSRCSYTPEQAGEDAEAFAAAARAARLALGPQPFDGDFSAFESQFLGFESTVSTPSEWTAERGPGLQGALDSTYVIGVINGATTFPEVLGAIESISVALHESEDLEFAALVAQE